MRPVEAEGTEWRRGGKFSELRDTNLSSHLLILSLLSLSADMEEEGVGGGNYNDRHHHESNANKGGKEDWMEDEEVLNLGG